MTTDNVVPIRPGGEHAWLARKVDVQAAEIKRLHAVLAAARSHNLAEDYVKLLAHNAHLADQTARREKNFVAGYNKGWVAALAMCEYLLAQIMPTPQEKQAVYDCLGLIRP